MKLKQAYSNYSFYEQTKLGLSTMNYWSKFNVKLHFVDGSENRIEDSNLSMFNENIRYHHFNIFSEIDRVKKFYI